MPIKMKKEMVSAALVDVKNHLLEFIDEGMV